MTPWMCIIFCVEQVQIEYKSLIFKLFEDSPTIPVVKAIISSTDLSIQNLLALPLLMPVLRLIDYLIKFS